VTLATLPPRRLRLLTAGVLAATFALGAIAGGGIYRWTIADRLLPADDLPRGPWPLHQLDLSDEQRARVRDIFERHRPKLDALLRESFPQVRAIHEQIDSGIRDVLTPEQRAEFDHMKENRRFPPPGLPPPPGQGSHRERPPLPPPDRR
jgi:Spy/CpxP family protein refolding chaperone